jgi:hypothetical protein
MKMSPLTLFCENCGAANSTEDTACFACKEPLQVSASTYSPPSSVPPAPTLSPAPTTSEQLLPGSLLNQGK